MSLESKINKLIEQGVSHIDISKILECSKSTVTYHVNKNNKEWLQKHLNRTRKSKINKKLGVKHETVLKKYYCKKCKKFLAQGYDNLLKTGCKTVCTKCNSNIVNWNNVTLNEFKRDKPNYQAHSRIRSIARTKYIQSGKPQKCSKCGYDKHYEVCHIKPVSDFLGNSTIEEINHIENLVALCPNCHWEFDKNSGG